MTISVVQTPGDRTFLQSVQRAIRSIGEAAPSTLANPTPRIRMAMQAVEDARDEVFYRAMWDFREKFKVVTFTANEPWYALDDDFHDFLTDPSFGVLGYGPPEFRPWRKVLEAFPDMRSAPPGSGGADLTTASQLSANTYLFGQPSIYTRYDRYIGFFAIPDAAFVAICPNAVFTYKSHAPYLESDEDTLGLPRNLWQAHQLLADAITKKAAGFDDWKADEPLGRMKLNAEVAKSGCPTELDLNPGHTINYSE